VCTVYVAAQEEELYKWQSVGGWRRVGEGIRLRCRRQSRLDGPFAPVRHDPMAPRIGLHTCTHYSYNNNKIFAKTPLPHVNVIMSADADANLSLSRSLSLSLSLSLPPSHSISIFLSRAHVLNIYIIRSLFIIYLPKNNII